MSEDYDTHLLLQHLDDPLRIFYWTIDEVCALTAPVFVGIACDYPLIGFGAAAISFQGLRYVKQKFGVESLKHSYYWYFPPLKKRLPHVPGSYIREYIG